MPPVPGSGASAARGGGRGRRRKGGEAEKDESERWLVSYADMMTVLVALFIMLYAISALNQSKFVQLKYSLAAVFGDGSIGVLEGSPAINDAADKEGAIPPTVPQVPVTSNQPAIPNMGGWIASDESVNAGNPGENGDTSAKDAALHSGSVVIDTGSATLNHAIKVQLQSFEQIKKEIDEHLDAAHMHGAAEYSINSRGLVITIVTDALVFPGNSADLLPKGQKLLAAVAPAIKKVPNDIEVDGYTNQLNVSTYPYPSGWELSSARASAVVRYLESNGLDDGRELSAVGFSGQRPLVPPDDPRSVTRNRRVEIVVLSSLPSLAGDAMEKAAQGDGGGDVATGTEADNAPVDHATNGDPATNTGGGSTPERAGVPAARGTQPNSTVAPTAADAPHGNR